MVPRGEKEGKVERKWRWPCGGCRVLRRKCGNKCALAECFGDDDQSFAVAHRVMGAGNVMRLLRHVPLERRADAARSIVYECRARVQDPVYGCAGIISRLDSQASALRSQIAVARARITWLLHLHRHCHQESPDCPFSVALTTPEQQSHFVDADAMYDSPVAAAPASATTTTTALPLPLPLPLPPLLNKTETQFEILFSP